MPIKAFLGEQLHTFDPEQIAAMGQALERACNELKVFAGDEQGRQIIASRVIDLGRAGIFDPDAVAQRVIAEARLSL